MLVCQYHHTPSRCQHICGVITIPSRFYDGDSVTLHHSTALLGSLLAGHSFGYGEY
jgi:hypothetical protein